MNLAPLLAELAGLNALPEGLLQPAQRDRLDTVRRALALAQHVLPAVRDDLPRLRLSLGARVVEGTVIGAAAGRLQFRLPVEALPEGPCVALLHFSDGRLPRALRGQVREGPSAGYWHFEADDGSLDDGESLSDPDPAYRAAAPIAI
jgi:hypothetical protein